MKKNMTYEFVYTHIKMEKIHFNKYQLVYAGHFGKELVEVILILVFPFKEVRIQKNEAITCFLRMITIVFRANILIRVIC